MDRWSDGYVAEIEYIFGYYHELNPLRVAMAFLNVGLTPPAIATACELAFGQGVSVNIHAAATSVRWHGTDFTPAQAGFARALAAASGSGAQLRDDSFADYCRRGDLPDFDFIALHGIYSWISLENQQVIVDFVRRKLKVGGVLYISYNAQPGFAAMLPLQHLLARHAEIMGSPGQGVLTRLDGALTFAEALFALNPTFAALNPTVGNRLRQIKGQNRTYAAHEYLNRHWHALPFAQIEEDLAAAKLTYACSASYLDHVDAVNMTADQQRFLGDIADPSFRQTVRDIIVNQQFRRDYWVKGARRLSPLEQVEAVRQVMVMPILPRDDITLTASGALGRREMAATIYAPILDALGERGAMSLGELETELSATGMRLATIYEAVMVLVGKGDVAPVQDEVAQEEARPCAHRLNQHLLDKARGSGDVGFLASPATGGGIAVSRFHQLFLLALRQGCATADALARFAWDILGRQGQRILKDGKALETPDDNLAELTAQAQEFLGKSLAVYRRLQVA